MGLSDFVYVLSVSVLEGTSASTNFKEHSAQPPYKNSSES